MTIPEEVFSSDTPDLSQQVLEAVAVEGFKSGQLSTHQVRRLLGLSSRAEVHEFLWKRGIPWVDYPVGEAERERQLLEKLLR